MPAIYLKTKKQNRRKAADGPWSVCYLALLLCGMAGLLALARGIPMIAFDRSVDLLVLLYSAVLWLLYIFVRKLFYVVYPVSLAGIFYYAWRIRAVLRDQFLDIGLRMMGQRAADGTEVQVYLDEAQTRTFPFVLHGNVTQAILGSALLVAAFLFFLEFVRRNHIAAYILMNVVLLAACFGGITIRTEAVILFAAFQTLFWVPRISGGAGQKILAFGLSCALFIGCLAAGELVENRYSSSLNRAVDGIEGAVVGTYERVTNSGEQLAVTGHLSRGNRYTTGRTILQLENDMAASEPLYLIGFRGGDYGESGWTAADEDQVLHNVALNTGQGPVEDWISLTFQSMYYVTNVDSGQKVHQTRIRKESRENGQVFQVYNGVAVDNGNLLAYFEQNEITPEMEQSSTEALAANGYADLESAYEQEARLHYTAYPEDRVPRLTAFVRQHPMTDPSEITAFILYFLENDASYTTRPGRVPANEDIVEHFLWSAHRGYCEQFASAATLMYRMYGIPARYVTGYRVARSAFQRMSEAESQEPGPSDQGTSEESAAYPFQPAYEAVVSDEDAHAWVEIFLPAYGWVPIDVTPGRNGQMPAQVFSGFDWKAVEAMMDSDPWKLGYGSHDRRSSDETDEDTEEENEAEAVSISESTDTEQTEENPSVTPDSGTLPENTGIPKDRTLPHWMRVFLTVLLACGLFVLCLWAVRVIRIRIWRQTVGRKAFRKLLQVLHRRKLLVGYNGNEPDFAQKLHEAVPAVSEEEAEEMIRILQAETFGPAQAGHRKQEDAYVRRTCEKVFHFLHIRIA